MNEGELLERVAAFESMVDAFRRRIAVVETRLMVLGHDEHWLWTEQMTSSPQTATNGTWWSNEAGVGVHRLTATLDVRTREEL